MALVAVQSAAFVVLVGSACAAARAARGEAAVRGRESRAHLAQAHHMAAGAGGDTPVAAAHRTAPEQGAADANRDRRRSSAGARGAASGSTSGIPVEANGHAHGKVIASDMAACGYLRCRTKAARGAPASADDKPASVGDTPAGSAGAPERAEAPRAPRAHPAEVHCAASRCTYAVARRDGGGRPTWSRRATW